MVLESQFASGFATGPTPSIQIGVEKVGQGNLGGLDDIFHSAMLIGEIANTASGTLVANDVYEYPISTNEQARELFGDYSVGGWMFGRVNEMVNPKTGKIKGKVYGCGLGEVASGTAASQTLTTTGTATVGGTVVVGIDGKAFYVSVAKDDTGTDFTTELHRVYNAAGGKDLPLIPYSAAGVLTLTASAKCAHLNNVGLEIISDPDCGLTFTWSGDTMGAVGGTPGVGVQTGSLDTVLASLQEVDDFVFYCAPFVDSATLIELQDHVNEKSDPQHMLASYVMCAKEASIADQQAQADALRGNGDAKRLVQFGTRGSTAAEGGVVAACTALVASEPHMARSVDGLVLPKLPVPVASDRWAQPDETDALLNKGIFPVGKIRRKANSGVVRLVSMDTNNGVSDFSKIWTADRIRSELVEVLGITLDRVSVSESERRPAVAHIVTPALVKATIRSVLQRFEENGYITDLEGTFEGFLSELGSDGALRQIATIDVVNQLHSYMLKLNVKAAP